MLPLELLKILFCTPFLLYGCYTDWKTRRVPNKVWLYMLPGATLFFLIDLSDNFSAHLVSTIFSIAITYIVTYLFFRFAIFGGADAKALIMISFILPVSPSFTLSGYSFPLWGVPLFPLFTAAVFYNAAILNAIIFPAMFLWNLLHSGSELKSHPHYFFLGYKTDIRKLSRKHARLLENYIEEGDEIKPVFSTRGVKITPEIQETLLQLCEKGKIGDKVWITPGIPYIIPITLGFLTAAFLGDILFQIIQHLMT